MKDFLEIVLKICLVLMIVFVGVVFVSVVFDDNKSIGQANDEEIRTWLMNLEVQEDEGLTAESLRKDCKSKEAAYEGFCAGYMLGFVEAHYVPDQMSPCDGTGLRTSEQAEQAFENFMSDHPEHWKKGRPFILGAALRASFPCSTP